MTDASKHLPPEAALADLFRVLIRHQGALLTVLRRKLDAMRRSDVDNLHAALLDESVLVDELHTLELRRQSVQEELTRSYSDTVGERARFGGRLRLSQVVACVTPALRSELESLAATLRARMLEVGELNRIVALVSRGVSVHLRQVLATAAAAGPHGGYGRNGREVALPAACLNEIG